jgi:hypothetical protein
MTGDQLEDLHVMGLAQNFDITGAMTSTSAFGWNVDCLPTRLGQSLADRELLDRLSRWIRNSENWR